MKIIIDSEELKKIETNMLIHFDEFCSQNGLTYYLAYGSLIGAIRHKGFIPWDDDIDVIMPRKDYEKLINIYNTKADNNQIKLLHHSLDPNYYLPIAKLIATNTVLKEDTAIDYTMGVYLDIFPLENLSNNIDKARRRMKNGFRYNQKLIIKTIKWEKERSLIKNLFLVAGKIALFSTSISRIIDDLERYCCRTMDSTMTKYVGVITGISAGDDTRIFMKEWFEKSLLVEFEGKKYPAPIGYDELLKQLYGDYMTPPPLEQQKSHHSFEAWYKE